MSLRPPTSSRTNVVRHCDPAYPIRPKVCMFNVGRFGQREHLQCSGLVCSQCLHSTKEYPMFSHPKSAYIATIATSELPVVAEIRMSELGPPGQEIDSG